jgi:hypothetical protein
MAHERGALCDVMCAHTVEGGTITERHVEGQRFIVNKLGVQHGLRHVRSPACPGLRVESRSSASVHARRGVLRPSTNSRLRPDNNKNF